MNKIEAKFQAAFGRWVQNRWTGGPVAFELKRTLGGSIPLSAIKDHQVIGLSQVAGAGNFYKIPDGGFAQSPYDCFFLQGKAYVALAYGKQLKGFYLLPISVIERLKKIKVVSITEKYAKEFGEYYVFPEK